MATRTTFYHDPDAVLDYGWDWGAWLATDELITLANVTATDTLTLGADAISDDSKQVTAWVTAATANGSLTCHIVTSAGREDDRTIHLSVRDR